MLPYYNNNNAAFLHPMNNIYRIDPKILNYKGKTELGLYNQVTFNGNDAIHTIHPIRAESKLMQWLQDHSQFFNSIIIWFISFKIKETQNCYILQSFPGIIPEPQYHHVIDTILFRHMILHFYLAGFRQEITLKKIYSGILDDQSIAEETKAEWIIESMTKNGRLRSERVDIMVDLLNEKQYFFEAFIDQIIQQYNDLNVSTQEKFLSYAFTHKDKLANSAEIEEKALELKNPPLSVFLDLSEAQQDEILENIENDISNPNGDAQKINEMKQIRNNLFFYRHPGEENLWNRLPKDVKYLVLKELIPRELKVLSLVAKFFQHSFINIDQLLNQVNKGENIFTLGFKSKNTIIEFLQKYGEDIRVINLDANFDAINIRSPSRCCNAKDLERIMRSPYKWCSAKELKEILNYLPNLIELYISRIEIDKEAAQVIADCEDMKNLECLALEDNNLDHEGVMALLESENLVNLTGLSIGKNVLIHGSVKDIANSHMYKLTHLGLVDNYLDDNGVLELANSPVLGNLRVLRLAFEDVDIIAILKLVNSSNLCHLISLDLWSNSLNDQIAQAIANSESLKNLTRLSLLSQNIGNQGALAIENSQNLEHLTELHLLQKNIMSADTVTILENRFAEMLWELD